MARVVAAVIALLPLAGLAMSSAPRVTNPHGSFKEDCGLCHGAEAWKPARISARFDHSRYGMRLEGAHAAAGCRSCHTSLDFARAAAQCSSCHEDPHRGELGADCARCHGSQSFLDRAPMVRAHAMTRFPLGGAHATLDCESCHPLTDQGRLRFLATSVQCYSCHEPDYRSAAGHVAGSFPLECRRCHSSLSWQPARFDHRDTAFPLTGAHRTAPCERCHGDGVYHGKPTDCASCHMDDYNRAVPDHRAAGFLPAACAGCHSTSTWSGVAINHDANWFPIYSGAHRGRWSSCADCHINPASFAEFSCLTCHPHSDRAETDSHHRETSGYRYDSQACYSCHPRGSGG